MLRPTLAVSACLLGQPVRFNGGHRHSRLCDWLAPYVDWVPICPEVGAGLGTPRPTLRLIGDIEAPRARDRHADHTAALQAQADTVRQAHPRLCGVLLQQGSPSCGLERVRLYNEQGVVQGRTSGVFSAALRTNWPELPLEEEGRLHDPVLRENFLVRVFAVAAWHQLLDDGLSAAALQGFHARYKYQLLANDPQRYRELGRLLADLRQQPLAELAARYFTVFMTALSRRAERGGHCNVLQHLSGHLKGELDAEDRAELVALIDQYRTGIVPLAVPLALLKHHFRRHPDPYVAGQAYLDPHPQALGLRSSI